MSTELTKPEGAPDPSTGGPIEAPPTDPTTGLTDAEVEVSRREHGSNYFSELPVPTIGELIVAAVKDPMLIILIVCAVIAVGLGLISGHPEELVDGAAITVAVLVVTGVGVRNQLKAQADYSALDAVASKERVRVIRNGQVVDVDGDTIVRGDVLEINTGDVLPADAVYVRGGDLLVNEAAITGEPDTHKDLGEPLFGSSRILDGSGRAVVAAVGDTSVFGKIRQQVGERDKTTPLQERLEDLAGKIGKGGFIAAGLTFVALIATGLILGPEEASTWESVREDCVDDYVEDVEGLSGEQADERAEDILAAPDDSELGGVRDDIYADCEDLEIGLNNGTLMFILGAITIAITIVVVAVPEGLPLAVTLSLSYTTSQMAKDKALVRELAACETMGAATIICSDKTGTLTAGAMTLASADIGGRVIDAEELNRTTTTQEFSTEFGDLIEGVAVNSSADLVEREGQLVVAGNSTDGALLKWLNTHGVEYRPIRDGVDVYERIEFNSARKFMMTAVRRNDGVKVYLKGAPEIVLGFCTQIMTPSGPQPLDDAKKADIVESVRAHARRGNRTLGFAIATKPDGTPEDDLTRELVFEALFVISDPIRPEVPEAVKDAQHAGTRVMIITGDIKETAQEIGRQAGVWGEGKVVLEGSEFRAMSDDDVKAQIRDITVLARALPDDKKRMAELLQATGDVVSMTGDGVNDAPALVTADVGFAMGSGTKVAREASDIVIVDDNFVTIVRAIRWGRSVFENIRKFLQFQLTVNVVALTVAFLAALFNFGTPLTAVQLLWVNLIMDSLAALALALEPPTDELFDQPPHGREEPLISRTMWVNILAMGAYQFVLLMALLFTDAFGFADGESELYRNTILFNAFVFLQIFNFLNCRAVRFNRSPYKGIFQSTTFLVIVGIIVVLQVVIIFVGGAVFSTTPIAADAWALSIVVGATALAVGALIRAVGKNVLKPVGNEVI